MGRAKDIILKVITAKVANEFVRRHHYSGKVVKNSQLHFGAFLDSTLHGVMSFGPSLDKRKIQGLVKGTLWNEFIELNRMAFDEHLPRNSESRCISVAMRLLKKNAPHIKWVISFADGTQCGDGAIYRASGFLLTGITTSINLVKRGDGVVIHKMTLESNPTQPRPELNGKSYYEITGGKYDFNAYTRAVSGKIIHGFQLRYIYFIDPAAKKNLTAPVISFDKIDELGAGMYKGENITRAERRKNATVVQGSTPGNQPGDDGRPDPVAQSSTDAPA